MATALHKALFDVPVGQAGSGRLRYAKAMSLYQSGQMSPELLEVYRVCCKFDSEDPVEVAEQGGVSLGAFEPKPSER